jgi:TolA-binding protein
MKSNNSNHSTARKFNFQTRSAHRSAHVRLLILLALTSLLVFLPGLVSKSFAKNAEESNRRFYVVSSHKNFDDADALVVKLKAQGYYPFRKTINIPNKGDWHRVYVNHYGSKKEAVSAGKKLREKGILKAFFLMLKPVPEDKKIILPNKKNKEDNDKTPIPQILVKKKTADVPFSKQQKVDSNSKKVKVAPSSINEKSDQITKTEKPDPLNTKEIKLPLKAHREKVYPVLYPVVKKDEKVLKKGEKPYANAMIDFSAERYEDALSKFKAMIKTEKNEAMLRRIADCYYFLAEKGEMLYFSEAIHQYGNIVRNYPDSKRENAQAIYRIAQSSTRLNLNSKALKEFKNLSLKYPESIYFPVSIYMMGKISYKLGNFKQAIMNFKDYIKKFPDGKHVRLSYFGVGDSYFQMRQFSDADQWYGNALKRWPVLEDVPQDTISNLGTYYFQAGKYNDALKVYFVYLNLFSKDKNYSNSLYKIARSFERMGQLPNALKILSLVVELYPGTQEARKSAVIMANIGLKDSKIKLPVYIFSGMDYYMNPIETYDKMMGKLYDLDWEEEVLFRKGWALIKREKFGEAFDNFNILLTRFPNGKYRKEAEKHLLLSVDGLIEDFYSKKDYLAVSEVYFNSDRKILFGNGNFDMLFKIGSSLKKIGLSGQATGLFDEMIKVFNEDKRINKLLLAMAKMDYDKRFYKGARKRLEQLLGRSSDLDKKTAVTARELLGDVCYKEGLFKEAVGFYSEVLSPLKGVNDSLAIRKKYADSLSGMGLHSAAYVNYKRVLKNCEDVGQKCSTPLIMGSYTGLGDCLYSEGKYKRAITMYEESLKSSPEGKQDMWAVFNIGRGYANLGNKPMADKSFSALKKESGNEFWSRVKNYYLIDKTGKEI